VQIPNGTAAVSADNQCSLTKVSHWETGKAELDWQIIHLLKRKSEDLQKKHAALGATETVSQENGCDNQVIVAAVFCLLKKYKQARIAA
jgi:hypothetical protein